MNEIVAANALLLDRITVLRSHLNAGHWLYLFINDFQPSPADTLFAFAEASFPGYSPIDLAGLFSVPLKTRDGEYVTSTPNQLWTCSGVATQTVFGWYVRFGLLVELSCRLATPIPVSIGVEVLVGVNVLETSLHLLT